MKPLRAHEVRLIRKKLKLSQQVLADALGISHRTTVGRWEAGRVAVTLRTTLALNKLVDERKDERRARRAKRKAEHAGDHL